MGHVWSFRYATVAFMPQSLLVGLYVGAASLTIHLPMLSLCLHGEMRAANIAVLNAHQEKDENQ